MDVEHDMYYFDEALISSTSNINNMLTFEILKFKALIFELLNFFLRWFL